MTRVDLGLIGDDPDHRINALLWLKDTYGTPEDGCWKMIGLNYIEFLNSKHATHFILKWS